MTDYKMIADDLTGANANCSLMKKIGLDAATLLDSKNSQVEGINAVAFTTNSRAMDPEDAYNIVRNTLEDIIDEDVILYSKRIDSTLRGNIGPEINAFFDVLDDDYIGILVPSYPQSGRIVAQGTMYVNGKLLINSDAGKDAKTPVDSSDVKALVDKGLRYKSVHIGIEEVEKGPDNIKKIILEEKKKGGKLLIFDGLTDDHIIDIAKGSVESKVKFFAVDPGPFTLQVADQYQEREDILQKVVFVVGSVTDTTIKQINELLSEYDMGVINVDAEKLAKKDKRDEEIMRASKSSLDKLKDHDFILITTTPYDNPEKRVNLKEVSKETGVHIDKISIMISDGIAEIAKNTILSDFSFAGIFISGGDITVAFVDYMEAMGIEIKEEIIPLAAYGRVIGGLRPSIRIISKGGMVGDKDAMKICMERLKSI